MKLRVEMIDGEYPMEASSVRPEVWDLERDGVAMDLYVTFANGIVSELRAEGDSKEALDVLRGVALGAGACVSVALTVDEQSRAHLHREGYDCYIQGRREESPSFIFIDPIPRPERF